MDCIQGEPRSQATVAPEWLSLIYRQNLLPIA